MRKMLCLLSMWATALPSMAAAQNYNPYGWNPSKIVTEVRNPHKGELTVLVAHRGLHASPSQDAIYNNTPENSRESLDNAGTKGIEAVEIDIRMTSDGVPVLTHDYNWGREAQVPNGTGNYYDPWKNVNANPAVASYTFQATKSWYLRNYVNFQRGKWSETPPSLEEILNHYKTKGFGFVLFIDVKDANALRASWAKVVAAGMYTKVIFKLSASTFPKAIDFSRFMNSQLAVSGQSDARHINFMPVYNTGDIAPNNNFGTSGGESKLVDSISSYMFWNSQTGENFFVAGEMNLKAPGGILRDPLVKLTQTGYNFSNGIFNPVPEYYGNGVGQWYNSDGRCCSTMQNYWFNGSNYNLPSDTMDGRQNLNFILDHIKQNYVNIITTDEPIFVDDALRSINRRNTLKYFR